jgi:hypothetical protein
LCALTGNIIKLMKGERLCISFVHARKNNDAEERDHRIERAVMYIWCYYACFFWKPKYLPPPSHLLLFDCVILILKFYYIVHAFQLVFEKLTYFYSKFASSFFLDLFIYPIFFYYVIQSDSILKYLLFGNNLLDWFLC